MFTVINPATEQGIAEVASTSLAETDAAVARSALAFESWRKVSPGERADLLRAFSTVVRAHTEVRHPRQRGRRVTAIRDKDISIGAGKGHGHGWGLM